MANGTEAFCSKLTSRLHYWVGRLREAKPQMKRKAWIEKCVVFFALEDCQDLMQPHAEGAPIICRFSMNQYKKSQAEKNRLLKILKNVRADHLKHDFAKRAVDKLSEFLVDFSLSTYSLLQALGSAADAPINDGHFELLVIAESEMDDDVEKVLYDLLKLTCVPAGLKVMVFKARPDGNERKEVLDRIQTVLRNACRQDDKADWIFVGIPGYKEWIDDHDEPDGLLHHLHVLDRESGMLNEVTGWWKWKD